MAVLRYRDPITNAWVDLPTEGAQGATGPSGPAGATGPAGTSGIPARYTIGVSYRTPTVATSTPWTPPLAVTVASAVVMATTVSTSGSTTVELKKNNVAFATLTLTVGSYTTGLVTFTPVSISPGDMVTVSVTGLGTSVAGLGVQFFADT